MEVRSNAKAKWAEKLEVSASGYYTWLQEREARQKARGDEYKTLQNTL